MKRLIGALIAMLSVGLMAAGSVGAQGTPAAGTPAATSPIPVAFGPASLIGGTWNLVSIVTGDKTITAPNGQIHYTIRLGADGSVALTADCNVGGGGYTLVGDSLTIENLFSTMMACPDGSAGNDFAAALTATHTISWQGDNLILTNAAGGAVITLAPALAGVVWQWTLPEGANAALDPADYTLAFTTDGKLAIGADCNRGFTSFLTNGDQLALREIAMTRALCAPGSLSNEFVAQIETATAYTIGAGQLTLTTPAGDMTFTAQPETAGPAATPAS